MFRTLQSREVDAIANHPSVRPFLGGTEPLNLANIVGNIYNFCFLNDEQTGCHLLINKQNGIYEVHTLSLPTARGKSMLNLMKDARAFMFLESDALELNTFVPDEQPATLLWAKLAGFRENFRREKCFNYNGKMIGGTYFSLSYQDWVLKDKENLKTGNAFHSQIEKFELLTHDDDAIHDAWAGAVCRSKNLPKAIAYYNQWAARTGFAALNIVSYFPYVVDFGSAFLQLNADQSLSVLKVNNECQSEPLQVRLV